MTVGVLNNEVDIPTASSGCTCVRPRAASGSSSATCVVDDAKNIGKAPSSRAVPPPSHAIARRRESSPPPSAPAFASLRPAAHACGVLRLRPAALDLLVLCARARPTY